MPAALLTMMLVLAGASDLGGGGNVEGWALDRDAETAAGLVGATRVTLAARGTVDEIVGAFAAQVPLGEPLVQRGPTVDPLRGRLGEGWGREVFEVDVLGVSVFEAAEAIHRATGYELGGDGEFIKSSLKRMPPERIPPTRSELVGFPEVTPALDLELEESRG